MQYLRQSTASQSVLIGPFVDSTNGVDAETGLTVANTDVRLSANGGNMAAKNSGGGTHDEAGWYAITLDATDTATVGRLQLSVAVAGALPVFAEFQVLEEAVYDALFASSAPGYVANAPVNVAQFGGTNGAFSAGRPEVNATHWGGTAVASAVVSANAVQISGDGAAADNAEAFFDGTGYAGTNNVIPTVTNLTNLPAAAATAAELAKVPKSDGTATWNATALASINAEADAAIETYHLDHLLAADYDPASKPGVSTALLNELVESDSGVSRFTANALEQAPTGGSAPTAGEIADAVWEEAIAAHSGTSGSTAEALNAAGSAGDPWTTQLPGAYGAGSAGKIVGDNINATVSSRSSHSAADVWAVATRILTAGTNIALAKGTGVTGFNDLDAAGVRSAVGMASANLDTQLSAKQATFTSATGVTFPSNFGALGINGSGHVSRVTLADTVTTNTDMRGTDNAATAASLATTDGKVDTINSNVSTLLLRITSTLFAGITSLGQWLGLLAGKQAGNSTARTELRATGAGSGAFDETTDSQEAIRDSAATAANLATLQAAVDGKPTLAQILAGGDVDGFTLEQTLKLCLAALAGKLGGADTTEVTIRAADDSKTRITATVTAAGNRTVVTLDASG